MFRANITKVFIVDNSYQSRIHFFKNLNHSLVMINDAELIFEKEDRKVKFSLYHYEEDLMTTTFLSQFDDDSPFRVIKPKGITEKFTTLKNDFKEAFTVSSMNPDGYSVTFMLTDKNDIRYIKIEEKGIDEQLQNLATGAMIALQHNFHSKFYEISRRLLASINDNKKDIHQFENGSMIAKILKTNCNLYDENEQSIIAKL